MEIDDWEVDTLENEMSTSDHCSGLSSSAGIPMSKLQTLNGRNLPACSVQHWNTFEKHVRMPQLYPPSQSLSSSRWSVIKRSLGNIQQQVHTPDFNFLKFFESIIFAYNGSQKTKWDLTGIAMFYENLTPDEKVKVLNILDRVGKLALQLPELCPEPVPLLRQRASKSIHLTRLQIACLLANAFWCTFPSRNTDATTPQSTSRVKPSLPIPTINFNRLFLRSDTVTPKLNCIINYFDRVTRTSEKQRLENEHVTFERRVLNSPVSWKDSTAKFTNLRVTSEGTIEADARGLAQVDFANKFVGGGVLGRGCLQEEIRFLAFTEIIISRLFTEELMDNECLVVSGCERYNSYSGYASSFKWIGNFKDDTDKDLYGRCMSEIIVMDAHRYVDTREQYEMRWVDRELNKAYCGFSHTETLHNEPQAAIATGNWGCGDFQGNRHLKSIIQLMAAAEARRDILYFTLCDEDLVDDMWKVYSQLLQSLTVGEAYRYIEEYSKYIKQTRNDALQLYHFIQQRHGSSPLQVHS